ncbi:hypothetical protein QR98_0077210 [Sarcoptes scabiei]|uniref:Uncharacterized protein n=1 Tax=Sarcoptes scabiei TaxID=52283 RepID=A0A132ADW7_SARSC|nr:hypothetical protein QR98_0077210 [Sarcoptes scabiei]
MKQILLYSMRKNLFWSLLGILFFAITASYLILLVNLQFQAKLKENLFPIKGIEEKQSQSIKMMIKEAVVGRWRMKMNSKLMPQMIQSMNSKKLAVEGQSSMV